MGLKSVKYFEQNCICRFLVFSVFDPMLLENQLNPIAIRPDGIFVQEYSSWLKVTFPLIKRERESENFFC